MSAREEVVSFARSSAHDLNNTLAALVMAVELSVEVLPEGSEELASLLARVEKCACKLAAEIEALPETAATWPLKGD